MFAYMRLIICKIKNAVQSRHQNRWNNPWLYNFRKVMHAFFEKIHLSEQRQRSNLLHWLLGWHIYLIFINLKWDSLFTQYPDAMFYFFFGTNEYPNLKIRKFWGLEFIKDFISLVLCAFLWFWNGIFPFLSTTLSI